MQVADQTLVGAEGAPEEPAPIFRRSPYLMLESDQGDVLYEFDHFTDGHRERLEAIAGDLTAACNGETYFVVEHTFTNRCAKCVDSVPKRGFRGN
jgi:hypothetical protein